MKDRIKVAALVGATGVGKSAVAVGVAERANAEIVSVDSMQIYRGMEAGTDKPTSEMRRRVPHHMLDLFDPAHEVTVAEFQGLARAWVDEVAARGSLPLLVGGSGLYFRAVVDELDFPPRSLEVREELEAEAERVGPEALHARLAELDPAAAARIESRNARRTVRALEVIELTGRPFSENADAWERFESVYEVRVAGLTRPRDELFARIERRVDEMLAAGLVDEVRALEERGLSRTARQALGYRQVLEAADRQDPVAIRDEIVRATKRFARRQDAWFRADPRITWFEASEKGLAEALVRYLGS
ncbi:MAG: tRNA (adenosine(37)-N6)-dimethylallyltransferase MiaA [Actinomycetota bacterium]